ncbi:MAG: hypothetical protein CMJ84_04805 [Planctomycetes bacterium]|nr:hypothetical protein [Planctomycetota bacterium]MDP6407964.1 hypothetical protein [Planctomycetota bacterium]
MDAPSLPATPPEKASLAQRFLFLRALNAAIGRAPIWVMIWAVTCALALAVSYSQFGWYEQALDHRYEPGSMVYTLGALADAPDRVDPGFRTDHYADMNLLDGATGRLGAIASLLMILFGAFSAGGWLQIILERTEGHSLRRFFYGGSCYFWRFFRLMLLSLLVLSLWGWVFYDWPWERFVLEGWLGIEAFDHGNLETLDSEWGVWFVRAAQAGLMATAFGLTLTWADYSRTRIALHDTRSTLGAGLWTLFTMLRHPIQTLRPMLALLLVEGVVIVGASFLARGVERSLIADPSTLRWLALPAVGLVVLMWRVVTRGARYQAAVVVSRAVVRPLSRPDPWKQSVGGPGGPRYPIAGATDDYEVAL